MQLDMLIIFCLICYTTAKKLPDIHWSSSNSPQERYAAIGDSLDILCPNFDTETSDEDTEQTIVYRVPKFDYEKCRLSSKAELLARCANPRKHQKWTVSFRQFNPNPSALDYHPGTTYYFISTSTGSARGLENDIGGLCASHNLKMVIHVTDKNGDISHHRHRHHHHQKLVPTTTVPPTTTTLPTTTDGIPDIAFWQNKEALWGQYYEKVVNDNWPIRDPIRAERVHLDEGNEKDRYPVFNNDAIDYQIHEIGDSETLISSSRSSNGILTSILLLISLAIVRL
ncbi:unnamed protein product [Auanema sp. JU1783]|nr:unnamed protein product [Auanema sp. JU1783]